jgi:hypothetical protein
VKRFALFAAAAALLAGTVPGTLGSASAGPSSGGFTSDNVDYVKLVPFEVGTATGARKVGNLLFVTSWKNFSIYDLTDPLNPKMIGTPHPIGFKFENEDVSVDSHHKLLIFSESLPGDALHIYDLQDLANPIEIATLQKAGDHTTSCLFDCKYTWGSSGTVVDMRRPDQPKIIGNWLEGLPGKNGHDVTEVSPGIVLTSTTPTMVLDARASVTHPTLLAVGNQSDYFIHSVIWPRQGKDRWALVGGETNENTRCDAGSAKWHVYDTKGYQKTHTLKEVDALTFSNGDYVDGKPAVNGLGCSPHWFNEHPTWKDGGLVALGAYEHGTRFLTVNSKGKIKEVGWFCPIGGSTSASYWITPKIVYNVDYARGIDILQYNGPLKAAD